MVLKYIILIPLVILILICILISKLIRTYLYRYKVENFLVIYTAILPFLKNEPENNISKIFKKEDRIYITSRSDSITITKDGSKEELLNLIINKFEKLLYDGGNIFKEKFVFDPSYLYGLVELTANSLYHLQLVKDDMEKK